MHAHVILTVFVAVGLLAACSPSELPVACGPQDRLPVPMSPTDMARLQGIADRISAEAMGASSTPGITIVDADETTGTVVVGASEPTLQLCETLHARYGPLVEVIYHGPVQLF